MAGQIQEGLPLPGGESTDEKVSGTVVEALTPIPKPAPKPARFWLVFVSLCLSAFTANLNATILSTAMPLIVRDIDAGTSYIWINAAYSIAAAAIQPTFGQLANIYGRRWPMLVSLALFTVGSGISGGATGFSMLVAGRTVQGLGGGGIMVLMEVIVSDLLPLRERAQYLGIVLSTGSLAVLIGPIVGGAFSTRATWRWCFYISVPIGGIGFILAAIFLRLKMPVHAHWKAAVARIDLVGNTIFIAATCSMLVGLVMGGQLYPWSSFHVIVPIVLGGVGWLVFAGYEISPLCKEPTMPPRIFSNRTAVTGFAINFISSMLLEWTVYYLPYYFQTLRGSTQLFSSVQVLPFNVFLVPSAIINGVIMTKTGQYKPLHWAGFGFFALASGLFSSMDATTSTVKWVFWQFFGAYGLGCLIMSILPGIQSSLPEADVAASTAVHAFLRSFGFVWGFTIPSLVFNNQITHNLNVVQDPGVRTAVAAGDAYSQANGPLLASLTGESRDQTLRLYTISLQSVWYTALGFSLLGFLLVFLEKRIKLRENLETEYGLEEEANKDGSEQA
ncbi:major facilitator superfamily domain-containing protein [Hypoxylon rubiginosum]|uniref:Major facilitator superfamily domain-containing protein n=1 Tax=Hypoxylon rubiginosum TaxID=110542 RepID=A0ACB9YI96_9PEZI|nr:major facilitator superfamily domain-containing protein [Hypoxylon rubiginosum]